MPGCRPVGWVPGTELEVRALAVGYGDAVLLAAPDAAMLVDTGPASAGEQVVERIKFHLGGRGSLPKIDILVLSHPHPDHAGGLGTLADSEIEIGIFVRNPDSGWAGEPYGALSKLRHRAREIEAQAGSPPVSAGSLVVTFLWPDDAPRPDPNDRSLAAVVSWSGRTLLFPGDVVNPAIQAEWCDRLPARIDLLKLPHHGDEVAPCLGDRSAEMILSVGENPYGLPRQPTLERWGTRIQRTDRLGEVLVRLAPAGP